MVARKPHVRAANQSPVPKEEEKVEEVEKDAHQKNVLVE
tara:strand:- start:463 stop:579 length:117 start_codon:yes stop_codon:yes gene_type:complete